MVFLRDRKTRGVGGLPSYRLHHVWSITLYFLMSCESALPTHSRKGGRRLCECALLLIRIYRLDWNCNPQSVVMSVGVLKNAIQSPKQKNCTLGYSGRWGVFYRQPAGKTTIKKGRENLGMGGGDVEMNVGNDLRFNLSEALLLGWEKLCNLSKIFLLIEGCDVRPRCTCRFITLTGSVVKCDWTFLEI